MNGALGRDGDPGESAQETLANLAGTPAGVFALHVQDVVLHLEGELIRITVGPSTPVGEPLHSTFPVAIEDLVAQFYGRFRTPCKVPPLSRRLAGETPTAFFHPSPNTPSKASFPPLKGGKCLPAQPVDATPPNALIRECLPRQNPSIWPSSIRTKPGWCSADLTLASGFGLCFHCKLGSSSVLRRPIETTLPMCPVQCVTYVSGRSPCTVRRHPFRRHSLGGLKRSAKSLGCNLTTRR